MRVKMTKSTSLSSAKTLTSIPSRLAKRILIQFTTLTSCKTSEYSRILAAKSAWLNHTTSKTEVATILSMAMVISALVTPDTAMSHTWNLNAIPQANNQSTISQEWSFPISTEVLNSASLNLYGIVASLARHVRKIKLTSCMASVQRKECNRFKWHARKVSRVWSISLHKPTWKRNPHTLLMKCQEYWSITATSTSRSKLSRRDAQLLVT